MPDPSDYDNQDDFISACISQRQDEHPEEDTDQSAAVCFSMWENKDMNDLVIKVRSDGGHEGMEFILSDATSDRYGDSIIAAGWDVANFSRNPIALFNHNPDQPIGRWENLSIKKDALHGHLQLAPKGTSARIDEIRALIDAGVLRAVSVGFRPIEYEQIKDSPVGGIRYLKSELVETSLVSVPANPNALAVAAKLGISDLVCKMVFAEHGKKKTIIKPTKKEVVYQRRLIWGGVEVVDKYYPTKF